MKKERIAQAIAIIGCIFGIYISFIFCGFAMFIVAFVYFFSLGQFKLIPPYVILGNTILTIAVSVASAAITFSKKRKVAAAFLIIFSILGNILTFGLYMIPSVFFISAAIILFIPPEEK